MLKIEYKKQADIKKGSNKDRLIIIVNDIVDENSYCYDYHGMDVTIYNDDIIEILNDHSFTEIGKHFKIVSYSKSSAWWEDDLEYEIKYKGNANNLNPKIRIQLMFDIEEWSKAWSISDFQQEILESVELIGRKDIRYYCADGDENILNGFGIEYLVKDHSRFIKDDIELTEQFLKDIVSIAINRLISRINNDSIVTYFQFPEEIKPACSQYLVYFSQFIADVGIEVNSEIKEEANNILFRVTPKNKKESLEYIREALSIYLNAPSQEDFHISISQNQNIATMQWEANVYHLKSQLALAHTMLEAKNATIENLKLSNYQYRQLLKSGTKEEEKLIEGIVTLKEYNGKGFSINLPEILRRLKRIIK